MTESSDNIALTCAEAGDNIETVYENVCTLTTEPDMSFNYATTDELRSWGFSEGCFTCFYRKSKDIIIQTITIYKNDDGARKAYEADVDFLLKNDYGKEIETKIFGEKSILLEKEQSDGVTYNLLFLKNNVFVGLSVKYEKHKNDNLDYLLEFAGKIESKIQG